MIKLTPISLAMIEIPPYSCTVPDYALTCAVISRHISLTKYDVNNYSMHSRVSD